MVSRFTSSIRLLTSSSQLSSLLISRSISVNTFSNGHFSWTSVMSPYLSPYYSSSAESELSIQDSSDLDTELTMKNYEYYQQKHQKLIPDSSDMRDHVDRY